MGKRGAPKTGGRKPGTPNKDKTVLREKAKALGIDPFETLLYFAAGDELKLGYKDKAMRNKDGELEVISISPELRKAAARDACKYLYPELRAIEHSGEVETGIAALLLKAKAQADKK